MTFMRLEMRRPAFTSAGGHFIREQKAWLKTRRSAAGALPDMYVKKVCRAL